MRRRNGVPRWVWWALGGVGAALLVRSVANRTPAAPPLPAGMHPVSAELEALTRRWQPHDAPDLQIPLLLADFHFEGRLDNVTTSGGFDEIGPPQTEGGGTGGGCDNPHETVDGATTCTYPPPGNPADIPHSRWGRACAALGYDPYSLATVRDHTAQVRCGLWSLHDRIAVLAREYPDLLEQPGSAWWGMVTLAAFGAGDGVVRQVFDAHRAELRARSGMGRWPLFVAAMTALGHARSAGHLQNKLDLARQLGLRE